MRKENDKVKIDFICCKVDQAKIEILNYHSVLFAKFHDMAAFFDLQPQEEWYEFLTYLEN